MIGTFYTQDGVLYQSEIAIDGVTVLRMSIEPLTLRPDGTTAWEWLAWYVPGPWREPACDFFGEASSLEAARSDALDAAIALLGEVFMPEDDAPPCADGFATIGWAATQARSIPAYLTN